MNRSLSSTAAFALIATLVACSTRTEETSADESNLVGDSDAGSPATAFPRSATLACSSKGQGYFEVALSVERAPTVASDYDAEIKHFDRKGGTLLATTTVTRAAFDFDRSARIGKTARGVFVEVATPASGADWRTHADDCHAEARSPGLSFRYFPETGAFEKAELASAGPGLQLIEANPGLTWEVESGIGVGQTVEKIDGRAVECTGPRSKIEALDSDFRCTLTAE